LRSSVVPAEVQGADDSCHGVFWSFCRFFICGGLVGAIFSSTSYRGGPGRRFKPCFSGRSQRSSIFSRSNPFLATGGLSDQGRLFLAIYTSSWFPDATLFYPPLNCCPCIVLPSCCVFVTRSRSACVLPSFSFFFAMIF